MAMGVIPSLRSAETRGMMRKLGVLVWSFALFVVAGPVLAASERDRDDCNGNAQEQRIAGCNRIIQDRGQTTHIRAEAYKHRGIAYAEKGDLDRAIGDFSEALRLEPEDAQAYYNRGIMYSDKGDDVRYSDRAIADFTEALRLDPKFANAYGNRGLVYASKGDLDRALADYNEALNIRPGAVDYYNRGNAHFAKGDLNRAITDYNDAIRLDPKYDDVYLARGRAYLYSGNLAKALADMSPASEVDPKDAYRALWVDIVGQRNNVPSRLSHAISTIDMTSWPAPVIRMFLGQMTPAEVLAAADVRDLRKKRARLCEANFYSGELALRQGAREEAARLFRLAASDCPLTFAERDAANAELKALSKSP